MRNLVYFLILSYGSQSFADTACELELAPKLSSTFYVWTLNKGGSELTPTYKKLIQTLQPGGVLLGDPSKSQTIEQLQVLIQNTKALTKETPFIGADFVTMRRGTQNEFMEGAEFGLGTGIEARNPAADSISKLSKAVQDACLLVSTKVKALAHRVVGINHPLGPVVESKLKNSNSAIEDRQNEADLLTAALSQQDLIPTLKHFPFTPEDLNLHTKTASIPLSEKQISELQKNFMIANESGYVVMTTHVSSPNVDQNRLVTFSPKWVGRLRRQIGNSNLIMTDGLFMLGAYSDRLSELSGLSEKQISTYFIPLEHAGKVAGSRKPYNYAYEPCYRASVAALTKYRSSGIPMIKKTFKGIGNGDITFDVFDMQTVRNQVASSACDDKALESYLRLLKDPNFDPAQAKAIGLKALTQFAEQSLLAGHDMVIMEGAPQAIIDTKAALLKRACDVTGKELKARIVEASTRIAEYKAKHLSQLTERASDAWIDAHRSDLEKLFFEIYPAINDPNAPCRSSNLERASKMLDTLSCQ